MPVTSFHAETRRHLTSFGQDAKPGDVITWSVGHPINGGEFTTIRLGAVVTVDERGLPLFDEDETDVQIRADLWATRAEIKAAKESAGWFDPLRICGLTFERNAFGGWREVRP